MSCCMFLCLGKQQWNLSYGLARPGDLRRKGNEPACTCEMGQGILATGNRLVSGGGRDTTMLLLTNALSQLLRRDRRKGVTLPFRSRAQMGITCVSSALFNGWDSPLASEGRHVRGRLSRIASTGACSRTTTALRWWRTSTSSPTVAESRINPATSWTAASRSITTSGGR